MDYLLYIIGIVLFLLLIILVKKINALRNIEYKKSEILSDKKILTIYYSNGGNTKNIGENLFKIVGGDLKEIEPVEKYPTNIFKMSNLIRKQMKDDYVPQIKNIDISNYEIIFVGSPIWNYSMSLPLKAFLKNNNFENKIIIPFFTCSGGVNKNEVINKFKGYTNSKEIKKPLFIFENGIFLVKQQIINWLNNM